VRILVIEDDERMAELLKQGLEEQGHAVDVVHDGPGGVWMATENRYAAVVLDVMLPGFDGFDVTRQMRSAGCWAPVLMLTARTTVTDRVKGLDAGADDYLAKPFSFDELVARLRALIRRGQPERPVVLGVGDIRLDPTTRRASRGDRELDLTAKEFALLELFMRHPNELLTRGRIIEELWDFAYDSVSNVVDQHIARLRRKTGPLGECVIETIRGEGYRLVVAPSGTAIAVEPVRASTMTNAETRNSMDGDTVRDAGRT
jgi:two-component system OmpR family response regulator